MLYLVATPIGNLGDITLRALETLRQVDFVASEDTRKTGRLLQHFEIKKRQIAFHEHNEAKAGAKIIALLAEGQSVAVVTNAGTPGISDPGFTLVRQAIAENIPVTMIPGGEIFQALEKGAIDATEFSLPVVDEQLGFGRVAKYNYFPGWHQPFNTGHMLVNLQAWNALNAQTRALIRLSCKAIVMDSMAEAESLQGAVIRDFAEQGVTAETLPLEILQELRRVSIEVLDEEASKDADFAAILDSQRQFSEVYKYWKQKAYLPRDF